MVDLEEKVVAHVWILARVASAPLPYIPGPSLINSIQLAAPASAFNSKSTSILKVKHPPHFQRRYFRSASRRPYTLSTAKFGRPPICFHRIRIRRAKNI